MNVADKMKSLNWNWLGDHINVNIKRDIFWDIDVAVWTPVSRQVHAATFSVIKNELEASVNGKDNM